MKPFLTRFMIFILLISSIPITATAQTAPPPELLITGQEQGAVLNFDNEEWILLEPSTGLLFRKRSETSQFYSEGGYIPWQDSDLYTLLEGDVRNSIEEPYASWVEERTFNADRSGVRPDAPAYDGFISIISAGEFYSYQSIISPYLGQAPTERDFFRNSEDRNLYLNINSSSPLVFNFDTDIVRNYNPILHVRTDLFVDEEMNLIEPYTDNEAPVVTMDPADSDWGTDPLDVNVAVTDDNTGVDPDSLRFLWTQSDETPNPSDMNPFNTETAVFTTPTNPASGNFYLHIKAADEWGNEANLTGGPYRFDNTSSDSPGIQLESSPAAPTNEPVDITATTDGEGLSITTLQWGQGSLSASDFQTGNQNDLVQDSFEVTDNGTYTVFARDEAGNQSTREITIDNIDRTLPTIAFTLNPDTLTKDDVEISVTADGVGSEIEVLKWAEGELDQAQIATDGITFTDGFTVTENGTYTLFAMDVAGNVRTDIFDVDIIVADAPELNLSITPDSLTNQPVEINATATASNEEIGNNIEAFKWAKGDHGASHFAAAGEPFTDTFDADENGTYTVYVSDTVGHETTSTIVVDNILTERPTITLKTDETAPTADPVTIQVTADVSRSGDGNETALIKWAPGDVTEADFETTGTDITSDEQFTVTENGLYTVFVQDQLGNTQVATITIDNIFDDNADLADLTLFSVEESVTLDPVFTPDQTTYHAAVPYAVTSLTVESMPASMEATVTVNGETVDEEQQRDVSLETGINVIDVTVTAELDTIDQVYTVTVERKEDTDNMYFTLDVNGDATALTTFVERETLTDGTTVERQQFDMAHLEDAFSQTSPGEPVRLQMNYGEAPADQQQLSFSSEAAERLQTEERTLIIDTPETTLTIPPLANGETVEPLQFSFSRIHDEADLTLLDSELRQAVDDRSPTVEHPITIFGTPVNIETGHADRPTALTFPVADGAMPADPDELHSMGVLIQQQNGDSHIVEPDRITGEADQLQGFTIEVDSFSTFTLFEAEHVTESFSPYILGYGDGLFQPELASTRAQIATMLARTLPISDADRNIRSYEDVAADYWASDAIQAVTAQGWLIGYSDSTFRPEQAVTRAEMAVIISRWADKEPIDTPSFPDVDEQHWAAGYIATAKEEGWFQGYGNGNFRPDQPLTRAETVTVLNHLFNRPTPPVEHEPFDDVPLSHWASEAIHSASASFTTEQSLFEGLRYQIEE